MKKLFSLFLLTASATLMTGCVTKGKPFQTVQPIPPGKGVLYVYNEPGHAGVNEVLINDSAVGCLNGYEYLAFLCDPGPLAVSTGWEKEINSVAVNIEPGQPSFVSVNSRFPVGRAIFSLGLAPDKFIIKPKAVPVSQGFEEIKTWTLAKPSKGMAAEFLGNVTAGTDLTRFKAIYVDAGKKNWETAPYIISNLCSRGYSVKSGSSEAMPSETDCLVKLKEHWFWDLGTYLVKLEVEFLNPQTKAVYASATIRRAIPQGRRGPKIMAAEALNAIFNHGMPAGVEEIR